MGGLAVLFPGWAGGDGKPPEHPAVAPAAVITAANSPTPGLVTAGSRQEDAVFRTETPITDSAAPMLV